MRPALAMALSLAAVATTGCAVDGSYVDRDLFECSAPADCGDGWGCVRGSPFAVDFCAPDCSARCDGVCVAQSGASYCLRGCRIREDGTASECVGAGFECIRVSAQSDEGVCYPASPCSESGDCAEGQACLSELAQQLGVQGVLRTDNLYCLPAPSDPAGCPPRSLHATEVFRGDSLSLCLPTCDATDTRCPPGFGCLRQLGGIERRVCLPGIYGIPCDDDSNCMLGRCLDTGAPGRFCTVTCVEADSVAFGCERLSAVIAGVGLRYHLECDPTANGGIDGGLCVPRYEIGYPCTTPESTVFTCAEGLDCRELPGSGDVKVCTRDCRRDEDCATNETDERSYCNMFFLVCLARQVAGEECIRPEQCLSGRCELGFCGE